MNEGTDFTERDRGLIQRFGLDKETFDKAVEVTKQTGNMFAPGVLKDASEKKSGFRVWLKIVKDKLRKY